MLKHLESMGFPSNPDSTYKNMLKQNLAGYQSNYDRGKPLVVFILWFIVLHLFVNSWIPGSRIRIILLRLFGARIGKGVVLKNRINIKFPWKLDIQDYSWIGENVWIDNLGDVKIGSHCCISQGVYLCTGSHNHADINFNLVVKGITIGNGVWLCAKTVIGPGISIGDNSMITLGSIVTKSVESDVIYYSNQNNTVRKR